MTDHVIDLDITRDALTVVADPTQVHRLMARYLPDLHGRSTAIRADTGTQLRIDLPSDPLGVPGRIRIRLRGKTIDPAVGTLDPVPELVDGTRIVACVAAERRNTDAKGVRVRAVSDAEAAVWVTNLLLRHGLHPIDLAVSRSRRFGTPPGPRFTVRDLAATITITDHTAAASALERGIGRGRAYGLGLVVPTTL